MTEESKAAAIENLKEKAIPAAPQPPAPLEAPPSSTELRAQGDDGQWERKFNSAKGEIKEKQRQWDEYRGQVQAHTDMLLQQIGDLKAQLTAATADKGNLEQQLTGLGEVQAAADLVPVLTERLEKVQFAMRFPVIVEQARDTTVTAEDGTETTTRTNTVLDMLLSSTTKGDDWKRMVEELSLTLAREPAGRSLDMTLPSSSPPPPATAATSLQELVNLRLEAYQSGDYVEAQRINGEIADMKAKNP